jgi:prepilin-type N-terminal cleavage/methylation domain-containing protein
VIPRTARQAREAGFTLIELLVALTLLAVLMAALFGALPFRRAMSGNKEQGSI